MTTVNDKKLKRSAPINDTPSAWESGRLGRDEAFVAAATKGEEAAMDDALGLQLISIRLPKTLIADLKALAQVHEIGYQPMMRDVLTRWVTAEKKMAKANASKTIGAVSQPKGKKAA